MCLLLAALAAPGCHGEHKTEVKSVSKPPTVQVIRPQVRNIVRRVGQPSFIESYERTSIYPKLTGYIEKWNVDIGDKVKKDQVLATLFIPELVEEHGTKGATVGLDKGYDSGELFLDLETRGVEPHGALTKPPKSEAAALPKERDKVAARHRMAARARGVGYRLSQKCRKKLEEGFGWLKEVAGLARSRVVGRWKIQQLWEVGAAAYNLVRVRAILAAA